MPLRRPIDEVAWERLLAGGCRDDRVALWPIGEGDCPKGGRYAGELGDSGFARGGEVSGPIDRAVGMPNVVMAINVQEADQHGPLTTAPSAADRELACNPDAEESPPYP